MLEDKSCVSRLIELGLDQSREPYQCSVAHVRCLIQF